MLILLCILIRSCRLMNLIGPTKVRATLRNGQNIYYSNHLPYYYLTSALETHTFIIHPGNVKLHKDGLDGNIFCCLQSRLVWTHTLPCREFTSVPKTTASCAGITRMALGQLTIGIFPNTLYELVFLLPNSVFVAKRKRVLTNRFGIEIAQSRGHAR